jgi:hypothetical protein
MGNIEMRFSGPYSAIKTIGLPGWSCTRNLAAPDEVWFMGAAVVARHHGDPMVLAEGGIAKAEYGAMRPKSFSPTRDCGNG